MSTLYLPVTQQLHAHYVEPVQKILERKAAYWSMLGEKDLADLPADEAKRTLRRMQDLEDEVEAIDRLCHATRDVLVAVDQDTTHRVSAALQQAHYDYDFLAKEYLLLLQAFEQSAASEKFLLELLLIQHQA